MKFTRTLFYIQIFLCNAALGNWQDPEQWRRLALHSTSFFDKHGWKLESCASYFDPEGRVVSDDRHIVSMGRKLYGYTMSPVEIYEQRAYQQSAYITEKMVKRPVDSPPYFLSQIDSVSLKPTPQATLKVYEQAYGLMGL